jgi:hypothetical protein
MPDPKPDDVDLHEEADSPTYADNSYKVEKWTRDGTTVDSLLYAGNSLGRPDPYSSAPLNTGRGSV